MINWQDDKDIFGRMFELSGDQMFNGLRNAVDNHDVDFSDALSWGQLKSKRWLVDTLKSLEIDLGMVYLCGGWYATLAPMLFNTNLNVEKIRSFDIDESCASIAECVNKVNVKDEWKFKASTLDIHDLRYNNFSYTTKRSDGSEVKLTETPNTIINTSCEHIENFHEWYDKVPWDKLLCIQSNNYFEIEDHVNCSYDLQAFHADTYMSRVLYKGEIELPKYKRFMKIGYK